MTLPEGLNPELWTFPCEINIKVMGLATHPIADITCEIAAQYCSKMDKDSLSVKKSRTGKYHSITLLVEFETKEKAEALYKALAARDEIAWTL